MSNIKASKAHTGFFVPVKNSILVTNELTTRARQILLVLELQAGASRIAHISHGEIAARTGYQLRTIERSLRQLREQGRLQQSSHGVIQLRQPIPDRDYVQVYEGVVYHPHWQDWQKHLLLFIMAQFRGRDPQFGIRLYSLNLYGRDGTSIEKHCRIPGNTKERRQRLREFIQQLEREGVIHVVEPATSNRPATCTINQEVLKNLCPDYERHHFATCRMTGSDGEAYRQRCICSKSSPCC